MIYVIATIEVRPEKRDAFLAEFAKIVPEVRAEAGCIEYGATVDHASGIDLQAPIRDNTAIIVEKWESTAALKAHLASPHMVAFREYMNELVTGLTLHILEPA